EARREAVEAERKARLREAEALVGEAHGIRHSRRPGQRFAALAALKKAAAIGRELEQPPKWFDRLRNEAVAEATAALALQDVHITEEWDGFPPGTHAADVSEDCELYVRATDKGEVSVRRVKGDGEVARLPSLGEKVAVSFDPGRLLAVLGESSRRFQLWDVSGTNRPPGLERKPVHWFNFRPTGKLVGLVYLDGAIAVYDLDRNRRVHQLAPGRVVTGAFLTLHPTAPFVAVSSYF